MVASREQKRKSKNNCPSLFPNSDHTDETCSPHSNRVHACFGKGAERLVHLWKILSPKYAGLVGRATVRDSENLSLGLTQILTKPLYSFLHILN